MLSKRHVFLSLGMTDAQFRELMTTLSLAPESCPYARELATRLYERQETEPKDLMLSHEEETEEVIRDRELCDVEGCDKPFVYTDEGPDGMCPEHHAEFHRTHVYTRDGWVKR